MLAVGGGAVFIFTFLRRRGWWWKLPLALALMAGPYVFDVVRVRMSEMGQSPVNATLPTSLLLMVMEPDTEWPYGILFDRLNKAPQRHELWTWQLDQLAGWCQQCIDSTDVTMVRRGIQIAGNIAGRGSDEAIRVLGKATMHSNSALALLALDSLRSQGDRIPLAIEEIQAIAKESRDPAVLARAAALVVMLKRL